MTKHEIVDHVSRFVTRFGMIMDPETMNIARDEAGEYDFRLISEGHYGVIHGSKMYVIIERGGQIGCSCDDMTYNRMDGSCCKHIIAVSRLMSPITKEIDKLDAAHLMNVCGWTGRELHPEEIQIPPDPLPGPGKSDGQEQGLMSATCQYCGKAIKRKLAADLKQALEVHEATCPERPKEQEQTETEDTKMEDNPTWDADAWNGATQGNFAAYDENGIADVIFTANDFEIGKPDKWGRTPYEFSVIQNNKSVVLSVASIRLMHALKQMLPIEGKRINIIRTGSGMDTKYEVQEVAI